MPGKERMDSCIEWQGYRNNQGYGKRGGKAWAWTKTDRVHRQVWMAEYGFIPPDVYVLHSCDNPSCINIEHLRAGSHADNMADLRNKQGPRQREAQTPQQKLARHNRQKARRKQP